MAKFDFSAASDLSATSRLYKRKWAGEGGGGGGGGSFSFCSFLSSIPPLFCSLQCPGSQHPRLSHSTASSSYCRARVHALALLCPVPCSHPRPEPSHLISATCPSAPSPIPTMPPPSLQPTASVVAAVAAQSGRCRALVHPVCAQYIATSSRGPCSAPAVLLDHRHGPYPGWFSL